MSVSFFFFNDTPTTGIYSLSLPDPLPFSGALADAGEHRHAAVLLGDSGDHLLDHHGLADAGPAEEADLAAEAVRSEEHTSELQSRQYLVCRLLLEKKNISSPC